MHLRLYKEDFLIIAHYLGSIVSLLGVAMLLPFFVALCLQEWAAAVNLLYGVGAALVAGSILRLIKIHPGHITSQQAIIVTGLSWMAVALVGAVPLYLSGHYASFLDATFEAVSAFTTTGLTLACDLDHMALSINMWRFLMQFIGGQGVLVAALALGLFSTHGGGGPLLYATEGRGDYILPAIKQTTRLIWSISGIVILMGTVAAFVCMLVAGIDPFRGAFHSLWLSIAAFDTGGFAPQSMGIIHYHSVFLELVVTIIGCLGCVSFLLYAALIKGKTSEIFRNIEMRTFFLWTSATFLLCTIALASKSLFNPLFSLIRRGGFTLLSAASNTGFSNVYPGQIVSIMVSGAVFAIILAMTVGGASGSTSGGIKTLRIGIIVKSLLQNIKAVLLPETALPTGRYHNVTTRVLTPEVTSTALTITLLYIASYVIGAVVGIVMGYDSIPAMFESISAASNTGLTAGVTTTATPAVLKVVYIFQMWTGRLEFITIFAVIYAAGSSLIHRRKKAVKHG